MNAYEIDKNVLCDELFVLLRQKVLSGGKYMQQAMCVCVCVSVNECVSTVWEDFDTKLC